MRESSIGALRIDGTRFRDAAGRQVLLRGVNLGGDSKVPAAPDGRTHVPSDFADHRTVSFVGRPFPLAEADEHFRRLAHWGFNCLRLLTTWEAIEHAGPGVYDEAYLDYFAAICRRAGDYGFHVFIDFHQDVWSRMSGGDGAPGWTFEAVGLDFTKFDAAGAAHVMQHRYDHANPEPRQDAYPQMSWSTNYHAPANAIMWSLFFAGNAVAPAMRFGGDRVQDFLQGHYLAAMRAVAERIADQRHVIGFDTLNEPGEGWIGQMLDAPVQVTRGLRWSPLDGLAVASGIPRAVERIEIGETAGRWEQFNAARQSIWLPGRSDPFREAGVWDVDRSGEPVALQPDHFSMRDGSPVSLLPDHIIPFFGRIATTIRSVRSDWLLFAEVSPFHRLHECGYPPGVPPDTVSAPHWYDYRTLVTKRLDADRPIVDQYLNELTALTSIGDRLNGGAPTLIGECGFPFDMNERAAFRRYASGARGADIWREQALGFEAMFDALDALQLSATIWNYTAENRNDALIGDGWNQEDLSLFSRDQQDNPDDLDSGGRAVDGFCRPYVRRAQGRLVAQTYDRAAQSFEATIDIDMSITEPCEIYLPRRVFGSRPVPQTSMPCQWRVSGQILTIATEAPGLLRLSVRRERDDDD